MFFLMAFLTWTLASQSVAIAAEAISGTLELNARITPYSNGVFIFLKDLACSRMDLTMFECGLP